MRKIPLHIAEKLIGLTEGGSIPSSLLRHETIDAMVGNGVLTKIVTGRGRAVFRLPDEERLTAFLRNHYGVSDLRTYIQALRNTDLTRAEAVDAASDSKLKPIRTFYGFPVNVIEPMVCKLNGEPFPLEPREGAFTFIYDFKSFIPPRNATIVGVENPENFRYADRHGGLFRELHPLFVSRYPQSGDLVRWLKTIGNPYLHFGDFDIAGLNIYVNEFQKHLGERARFFLPDGVDALLAEKGNRAGYDRQELAFDANSVSDENVRALLAIINRHKKGLEQEALIGHAL
jgi:hypothetical protein